MVNRASEHDVPSELVERIRTDNQLDFELYAHALQLLDITATDEQGRPTS